MKGFEMTVYAFFMTLLVGAAIGCFATVATALHMERKQIETNRRLSIHPSGHGTPYQPPFNVIDISK